MNLANYSFTKCNLNRFQHLELQKASSRIINKNIMEDQALKSLIKYQLVKDILSSQVTGSRFNYNQELN